MFASNAGKTIHSNHLEKAIAELKIGKPYLIVSQKNHILIRRLTNDHFALFDPQFEIENKSCNRTVLCLEIKKALALYGESAVHYREISPLSKTVNPTKIAKLVSSMREKLTPDLSDHAVMTFNFGKD